MQNESRSAIWSARFQAQLESGLTVQVWCKQNGISKTTFYVWQKRLHQAPATASPKLIALPLPLSTITKSESALELVTPHGYVIRLSSQAHVAWLKDVLAELR
jgi:hypothetical protein